MATGTYSEYAKHIGKSPAYVNKLKGQGRLILKDVDGKKRVDFAMSDRLIQNTADMSRAGNGSSSKQGGQADEAGMPPPGPAAFSADSQRDMTYRKAQAHERVFSAKIEEVKYKQLVGHLLDREHVDRAMFEIGRDLRDALTACSRRIASEVASVSTAEACEAVIDREHRIVLQLLVTGFREKIGAAKGAGQ